MWRGMQLLADSDPTAARSPGPVPQRRRALCQPAPWEMGMHVPPRTPPWSQLWSMRLPTDEVPTLPEPLGACVSAGGAPCAEPPLNGAAGKLPGSVPAAAAGSEGTERLATCNAAERN